MTRRRAWAWVAILAAMALVAAGPAVSRSDGAQPAQKVTDAECVGTDLTQPHQHGVQVVAIDPDDKPPAPDHPAVQVHIDENDTVEWCATGDNKLRVWELKAHGEVQGAKRPFPRPKHPFFRRFREDNPRPAKRVQSGAARAEAQGYQYKYRVRVYRKNGQTVDVDPHIQFHCGALLCD